MNKRDSLRSPASPVPQTDMFLTAVIMLPYGVFSCQQKNAKVYGKANHKGYGKTKKRGDRLVPPLLTVRPSRDSNPEPPD